jgi:hypothetical protein
MNVRIDPYGTIHVTLSRRNLKTLLLKLDEPASVRTLERLTEEGHFFIITSEEDDIHYGEREPGPMHPREEARLSGQCCERDVDRDGDCDRHPRRED